MSCDKIIVKQQEETTQITETQEVVEVVGAEDVTTIVDNQDVVEVTEQVREKIVINATEVELSTVQSIDVDMNCTASEQVGDAVYVLSDGEVRQADNSDISTAKVVGFIVSKTGDTNCKVRIAGTLDDLTGLTPGGEYFLDNGGGNITETPVTTSGSVLVRLGQGLKDDLFLININSNYIIRS